MKILIDNGHGVNTKGKHSPDGTLLEYKWTREVAAMLVSMLKGRGMDAELLVPEDADIPLGQRCMRVNAVCDRLGRKNVLLISIHVNAAGDGSRWMAASGWEAYTSPGFTDSDRFAECLYEAARKQLLPLGFPIRSDRSDGDSDKEARFAMLTMSKCPAVLTENLFMDNPEDCRWLLTEAGKRTIAALHAEGICNYIAER